MISNDDRLIGVNIYNDILLAFKKLKWRCSCSLRDDSGRFTQHDPGCYVSLYKRLRKAPLASSALEEHAVIAGVIYVRNDILRKETERSAHLLNQLVELQQKVNNT